MKKYIDFKENEKIHFFIDDQDENSTENSIIRIADELQNQYVLSINGCKYRFIEIEFYFWSPNHQDPYVHGNPRQKQMGKFDFHPAGIDITIGTSDNRFGGILLRRLYNLTENKYINGPLIIYDEIVKYLANCAYSKIELGITYDYNSQHQSPIPLKRINLQKEIKLNGDKMRFKEKLYRFIINKDDPDHKYLGRSFVREK